MKPPTTPSHAKTSTRDTAATDKNSENKVKPSEEAGTAATGKKNSDAKVKPSEEAGGPTTKRRRHMCACDCHEGGIIRLVHDDPEQGVRLDDDPEQGVYRCTCRLCGPIRDDTRQCEIRLTPEGAAISLAMDGQLICFDCRGFE